MTGIDRRPRGAFAAVLTGVAAVLATQAGLATPAVAAPEHTSRPATAFTYVASRFPTHSFWNTPGADARVGRSPEADGGVYRSYFRVPTDGLTGKTITRAYLRTTQTWSYSCQPTPVDLWQTGEISSATTWRNKPIAVERVARATPPGTNGSCGADQAVDFDVTSVVRDAAAADLPEVTFALRAPDEADRTQWHRFGTDVRLDVQTIEQPPAEPSRTQTPGN